MPNIFAHAQLHMFHNVGIPKDYIHSHVQTIHAHVAQCGYMVHIPRGDATVDSSTQFLPTPPVLAVAKMFRKSTDRNILCWSCLGSWQRQEAAGWLVKRSSS